MSTTEDAPAEEAAITTTRSKRERKQTTFFQVPNETKTKTKRGLVASTDGSFKLGDYQFFAQSLAKVKSQDEILKNLHSILFSSPGKKTEIKKNIKLFSGFAADESAADKLSKVIEKKKVWTVAALKEALELFGLEKGGDREALAKRLIDYLSAPSVIIEVDGKGKKRKAKGSSTEPAKKKKKRTLSAFILFSNSRRQHVRDSNPDATFGEIGRLIGEEWKAVSDKEKKVWEIFQADINLLIKFNRNGMTRLRH